MTPPLGLAIARTVTAGHDAGRSERAMPCALRTWCIRLAGHDGACHEVPRYAIPPSDYGPGRKPRWAK